MARALNEREELASRLANQEKYAVLGKLASGMAHEVNNPLGGLFNAVDTLRRHGDDAKVREATLNLLERGLTHVRNVVGSTLVTYRREVADNSLRPVDIDDLRLLIEPEASRKRLQIAWVNNLHGVSTVAVESVRQVILNLLINACAATSAGGTVHLRARAIENRLTIDVGDQGSGLPDDLAKYLVGHSDEAPGYWARPWTLDCAPSRRGRRRRDTSHSGKRLVDAHQGYMALPRKSLTVRKRKGLCSRGGNPCRMSLDASQLSMTIRSWASRSSGRWSLRVGAQFGGIPEESRGWDV